MPPDPAPAAFVDRDGVINAELDHVWRIEDFRLLPRAVEGLRLLDSGGFALVIVTNQAGIAKGLYTEGDYQRLTRYMLDRLEDEGVRVTAVYHCPHHPQGSVAAYAIDCDCRKPRAGMILRAAAEHGLDLPRSVLIGDKVSDVEAARAAGVGRTVLVASGHPLPADAGNLADHVCADLYEAARWSVSEGRREGIAGP
jgi:D-glycero-D-manno-heptose 1,7-bisphosphate phosphatase